MGNKEEGEQREKRKEGKVRLKEEKKGERLLLRRFCGVSAIADANDVKPGKLHLFTQRAEQFPPTYTRED